MLYFDRNDVSEETDGNKTSDSIECDICQYWYFLDKALNFSDVIMLSINGADYCWVINGIS